MFSLKRVVSLVGKKLQNSRKVFGMRYVFATTSSYNFEPRGPARPVLTPPHVKIWHEVQLCKVVVLVTATGQKMTQSSRRK